MIFFHFSSWSWRTGIISLLLLLFIATSCKKEETIYNSSLEEDSLFASCETCGEGCSFSSVLDAIKDTEDSHNDRMNMILYHYGVAAKAALQNPTHKTLIINALTNDTEDATSLLALATENTAFASFFNEELRQSVLAENVYPRGVEPGIETLIQNPAWDANSYLSDKMVNENYIYDPVLYEVSPTTTLSSNTISVLIAQEVNDCDDVVGWTGNTEVVFSESEATTALDLVLIVGPGNALELPGSISAPNNDTPTASLMETDTDNSYTIGDDQASERSVLMGEELISVSGKIKGLKYRYEKSGKSEIINFVTGWTSNPESPFLRSNKQGQESFKKREIQDQVTVSINRSIAGIIESPSVNLFVGYYEYDWYISNKNLKDVACPCNSSVPDARLAMKYKHEWYNTDKFCGTLSSLIPSPYGSKTINNYKGTFVLKRRPLQ